MRSGCISRNEQNLAIRRFRHRPVAGGIGARVALMVAVAIAGAAVAGSDAAAGTARNRRGRTRRICRVLRLDRVARAHASALDLRCEVLIGKADFTKPKSHTVMLPNLCQSLCHVLCNDVHRLTAQLHVWACYPLIIHRSRPLLYSNTSISHLVYYSQRRVSPASFTAWLTVIASEDLVLPLLNGQSAKLSISNPEGR